MDENDDWEAFDLATALEPTQEEENPFKEEFDYDSFDTQETAAPAELNNEFFISAANTRLQCLKAEAAITNLSFSLQANKKWKEEEIRRKGNMRLQKKIATLSKKGAGTKGDSTRKIADYAGYIQRQTEEDIWSAMTVLEREYNENLLVATKNLKDLKEKFEKIQQFAKERGIDLEQILGEIIGFYKGFLSEVNFRISSPEPAQLAPFKNKFIESLFTDQFKSEAFEKITGKAEFPLVPDDHKWKEVIEGLTGSNAQHFDYNYFFTEKLSWSAPPRVLPENDDEEKGPSGQATWMEKYAFSLNMEMFADATTDFPQKLFVLHQVIGQQLELEAKAAAEVAAAQTGKKKPKAPKANKKAKQKPVIGVPKKVTSYEKDISGLGILNFDLRAEIAKKTVLKILNDKALTPPERKRISLNVLFSILSWYVTELNTNIDLKYCVPLFTLLCDIKCNYVGNLDAIQNRFLKQTLATLLPEDLKVTKIIRDAETEKRWTALRPTVGLAFREQLEKKKIPGEIISIQSFQLRHCGNYMLKDRNPKWLAHPDVSFIPDDWQYDLLKLIDEDKSALVVVPTSAGKTFSSFYVISRMLQKIKNGLAPSKIQNKRNDSLTARVVFVAPTMSLVNQMAADIYYRYGKERKCGICTTEYKSNVNGAEILICTPDTFQRLLLNAHHQQWAKELLYVIFDEIHCIAEQNIDIQVSPRVYTQALSLVQCPFLALSATVKHPERFQEWLSVLHGSQVHLIPGPDQKVHRWTDLPKYKFEHSADVLPWHPLEDQPVPPTNITPLHPFSLMEPTSVQFISNIDLSPKESFELYCAMKLCVDQKLIQHLEPQEYFQSQDPFFALDSFHLIRQADVFRYQHELKEVFRGLDTATQKQVQEKLATQYSLPEQQEPSLPQPQTDSEEPKPQPPPPAPPTNQEITRDISQEMLVIENSLELFYILRERKMLPAIAFVFEKDFCEKAVSHIVTRLETLQPKVDKPKRVKDNSAGVKEAKEKEEAKEDDGGEEDEDGESQKASKRDIFREIKELQMISMNAQIEAVKDYRDSVHPDFSLLSYEDPFDSNIEWWLRRLLKKTSWKSTHPLVKALMRGIAAYHAHLPKPYRDLVETLFRESKLKVVISTTALSLGINMPCKSVIFLKDAPELTPATFKQMAGRAGRRGFDHEGFTVFFEVSSEKIEELLFSPLHELKSASPLDLDTVLKMLILYNESTDKALTSSLLRRLLITPMSEAGNPEFEIRTQLFVKASLEFFYRMKLIDERGHHMGLAGLVSSISSESLSPANYAFAYLIANGGLNEICEPYVAKQSLSDPVQRQEARRKLLAILASFLFVVPATKDLPKCGRMSPIPQQAKDQLLQYNKETTALYQNIAESFSQIGHKVSFPPPLVDLPPENNLNNYVVNFFFHKKITLLASENLLDDYNAYLLLKKWNGFLQRMVQILKQLYVSDSNPIYLCFSELSKEFDHDFWNMEAAAF